jgi:hypothetical protein
VRLWPTSNKPIEWNGRAALMQSWARWSEQDITRLDTMCDDSQPFPIQNETGHNAFMRWIEGASMNDSGAALYALRLIRAKARRSRMDTNGIAACRQLLSLYTASSTRVRGFRLPNIATAIN